MPKDDLVASSSRLQEWLKWNVKARAESVGEENEHLKKEISELKRQLYSSKFIQDHLEKGRAC